MTSTSDAPAADGPAHYRLGDDTWEMILKEYREGATAPFLARKWRVSEYAVRRRVTKHGATKRDWGDAQAVGQALAREAELEEARRNSPEAVAARLFAGIALDEAEVGDAGHLARVAMRASGRAMTGRLWTEAKALAGLAESYARLDVKAAGRGEFTLNDMVRMVFDLKYRAELMALHPDRVPCADTALFHELKEKADDSRERAQVALATRGYHEGRAELRAELGLEPQTDRPDVYRHYADGVYRIWEEEA